jgi:hypothetical protein
MSLLTILHSTVVREAGRKAGVERGVSKRRVDRAGIQKVV